MPHGTGDDMFLKMLPATFWTSLKDGDILLLDEFLRGFPEVYNGLLDILTSRRVGAFRLPKVFIIGASNSVTAYDQALEDRLLHLPVPDPRKRKTERDRLANILVDVLGLLPSMATSTEMQELLDEEVLPMYALLDSFKKTGTKAGASISGSSVRNLIGQAQLRIVQSGPLKELLMANNVAAMQAKKPQYVLLVNGSPASVPAGYKDSASVLVGNHRLTEVQRCNLTMNLQLIELEEATTEEVP